jgi:hypothetical protein
MATNDETWLEKLSVDEIAKSLLDDMEMLRDGSEWWSDRHSIEAHCELITELQRRAS